MTEQTGVKNLSLLYCAEHGDKAIEWFCEKDDVMFCDTCKRIKHRKCPVTSVSDKKAFGHAQSLADVKKSLVSLSSRITRLKTERQNSAKGLEDVAYACQLAVHQFKSSIIETVERLGKELLSDINKAVTTEAAIIQDYVYTCDSLIPQLEDALTTADEAKTAADDVTNVIAAHKLAKALNTIEPTVSILEQEVYKVQIQFKPSGKLAEVFSGTDQLGILEIDRTETVDVDSPVTASDRVAPVSARTSWSDMQVVSSTVLNVQSSNVTGSAVMPDGRLILADYSNIQIILLDDQYFTIQCKLPLAEKPWDVAVYGNNAAVVTLPDVKQLLYIHVDTTCRASHTIPTGERCLGVAVHGGEIYAGVSRGQYGDHVQVMDTRGNVTRRIGMDFHGGRRYIYAVYVTVGLGDTVYIYAAIRDHITCYTEAGEVVYDVKHEGTCMSDPCGMFVDEEDNLLVCCYASNTIHVLGKDGAHYRAILSSADGVVHPQSVSYRRSDQTLIVTMKNTPSCRAYKLK
ncbi:MAG: B-box zinc finger protein [Sedimenticola sp.]